MPERVRFAHEDLEFARAVTFFDAIFAFAVTLLITTVDDFSRAAWSSLQALKATNGPSLLAFTISFVVVVSFWRAHHQGVTSLSAMDGQLLGLNLVVMFGIVLIPFTTEALGKTRSPAARRRVRAGHRADLHRAECGGAHRGPSRAPTHPDDDARTALAFGDLRGASGDLPLSLIHI